MCCYFCHCFCFCCCSSYDWYLRIINLTKRCFFYAVIFFNTSSITRVKTVSPATAKVAEEEEQQFTYSSDEEADYEPVGGVETKKKLSSKSLKTRRQGVSAESTSENDLKKISTVPNIPKTPEVATMLRKIVTKSPILRVLDAEQKDRIVCAFRGPIEVAVGEDIIKQGEIGESFYLLETGSLSVMIKKGKAEVKVHTYKAGDAFGQLALLYNAPRAASCRAVVDSTAWVLDRSSVKIILAASAMHKRASYLNALMQVPVFQRCTEFEMLVLADSLSESKYSEGAAVCVEKEQNDRFFIVKEGTAQCTVTQEDGSTTETTLSVGSFWGEYALVKSQKSKFTVTASMGSLKVGYLDRNTFERVLGPLEDILQREDILLTK